MSVVSILLVLMDALIHRNMTNNDSTSESLDVVFAVVIAILLGLMYLRVYIFPKLKRRTKISKRFQNIFQQVTTPSSQS